MDNTPKFELPLVQASQSQKHVTVNEAVIRLEAMAQLRLESISLLTPPVDPIDGSVFAVPAGAGGDWAGREGELAIASNGGWDFLVPKAGWRGWEASLGAHVAFDGQEWRPGVVAVSPNGADMSFEVFEIDHTLSIGATSETVPFIPAGTIVFGVTGRVLSTIGGATSFNLGIAGESPDRYGTGYGIGLGSFLRGITGQPVAYYSDTALTLTAAGGAFSGGSVRLAVQGARLGVPRGD